MTGFIVIGLAVQYIVSGIEVILEDWLQVLLFSLDLSESDPVSFNFGVELCFGLANSSNIALGLKG